MNNKTKGIAAGAAGVALLLGGTTFALWSDSEEIPGGVITSGNLDVAACSADWFDISADRTALAGHDDTTPITGITTAHAIDIATWRMVPEDEIEGNLGIQVALEGDNLVAQLDVEFNDAAAGFAELAATSSFTTSYDVYAKNAAGAWVLVKEDGVVGLPIDLLLQAPNAGQADGVDDPGIPVVTLTELPATACTELGEANIAVVVTADFDAFNQDDVQTDLVDLGEFITVTLDQVRYPEGGSGFQG